MQDKPAKDNPALPRQRAGALLKETREKLGLSHQEVAAHLNLKAEIVDAVEKDDVNRLPVAAYVRGYIRSYARIVNLDADTLIRLYDQVALEPPEIIPNIKKPGQASSHDKPVRAVTYLISFTLALLLLAWLQGQYLAGQRTRGNTAITDQDEKSATTAEMKMEDSVKTPSSAAAVPAETLSLTSDSIEITENEITATLAPNPDELDTNLNAETIIDPAQIAEELSTGVDRVSFSLSKNSWIEVLDSNKSRLYHDLAKSGERITLTGKAPFTVVLGYAPGVEISFNGAAFDPAPYTNAGVARFKLGDTGEQE
jgi:Uncharacterized protein conserved in bacteria